jgi:dinuclear metal center YbgI/SA1388 family protein
MSTVQEICSWLDRYAPPDLAEDWDNTGLLLGRENAEAVRLMTCLTLTPDVVQEAVDRSVQLVVTHHPLMFRGTKQITDATVEGRSVLKLIEAGVAVYSPHTRFDSAADGINQQLAVDFGLDQIQPLRSHELHAKVGQGRWGMLPEGVPLTDFLHRVQGVCRTQYLEYCGDVAAVVRKVAVACGAAGEFLADAQRHSCDVFVTGEGRFHAALEARETGVALVFVGHYASERPAVERLADLLSERFPAVGAFASQVECDPLQIFDGRVDG